MRVAVKLGVAASLGVFLAMFAVSSAALGQGSGGSVTATATAFTPNPVACGQPAASTLNATATPPTLPGPYNALTGPKWSWTLNTMAPGVGVEQSDPFSPAATLTAAITSPGVYPLSATATATWKDASNNTYVQSGSTGPLLVTVVGVQNLQYLQGGAGYADVSGVLHVLVGQSVTFHAVPTPAGSAFPSGQPIWSGSSGASGSGDTVSVAFNQLSTSTSDYKTVIAACGSSSVTANVIVFDLLPIQTPQDNFAGRDLTAYGVCETVNLSYQTTPAGISDYDIGGLQWQIISGGGTLSGGAGGVNTYQCPDVATTVNLSLVITGGPMLGLMRSADAKDTLIPDAATVLQQPGTDLWHVKDMCSAGFCGDYYATCAKTLSFKQIVVREGNGFSKATGYRSDQGKDGVPHEAGAWYPLLDLVKDKG
jgi:hypothetical protein